MEEPKYFMWYDSDDRFQCPTYGPHYYCDEETLGGKKCYHTLEELLKTSISDSIKKRLAGAKVGTKIKIHYLHSNGDLMVKCVSAEEVKILDDYMKNVDKVMALEKQVREIEAEQEKICKKLGFKQPY